jgi:hypothetical protein
MQLVDAFRQHIVAFHLNFYFLCCIVLFVFFAYQIIEVEWLHNSGGADNYSRWSSSLNRFWWKLQACIHCCYTGNPKSVQSEGSISCEKKHEKDKIVDKIIIS